MIMIITTMLEGFLPHGETIIKKTDLPTSQVTWKSVVDPPPHKRTPEEERLEEVAVWEDKRNPGGMSEEVAVLEVGEDREEERRKRTLRKIFFG